MDAKSLDQESLAGSYIIKEMGDEMIKGQTLKITFESNSDRVTGFGGCNSFFGTYTLKDNKISFSDIASSKKFCGKAIGDLERNFFSTLKSSTKIELDENHLLFHADDSIVLKAEKAVVEKNMKKAIPNASSVVIYKAISRGSFDYIKISDSKISVSQDRNLKVFSDYNCTEEDKNELISILDQLNLAELENLKAPTDKRLFDGAPIATLTIIKNGIEKTTPSFDHGHPPKEIETLVNKVLSIKENVTKQ
ncbi:META domain-containing protein [Winogradskyella vincentii]|uniref:META domain-containing protein n=1 Tax=Winogradskyella vincentii TaxID=2877122 RepID=A0ABS7XXW6_9FLAO|nr:META domain-containing protein [Winogradskyella vincentii]MCA0152501.1 META domain-containing protein [Winogradskyella vincentii]